MKQTTEKNIGAPTPASLKKKGSAPKDMQSEADRIVALQKEKQNENKASDMAHPVSTKSVPKPGVPPSTAIITPRVIRATRMPRTVRPAPVCSPVTPMRSWT